MLVTVSHADKYFSGGHHDDVEQNIGIAGCAAWISSHQGFIQGEEVMAKL
jgi:hypothetical protein